MNFKSKATNILKQNMASARATMTKHAKSGGDKTTHDRAKMIYDAARLELARRGVQ